MLRRRRLDAFSASSSRVRMLLRGMSTMYCRPRPRSLAAENADCPCLISYAPGRRWNADIIRLAALMVRDANLLSVCFSSESASCALSPFSGTIMTARAGDFDVNVWTANAAIPPAMARTMAIVMVRMGFPPFSILGLMASSFEPG